MEAMREHPRSRAAAFALAIAHAPALLISASRTESRAVPQHSTEFSQNTIARPVQFLREHVSDSEKKKSHDVSTTVSLARCIPPTQNPMAQIMMRNNPRFANNSMLQQSLDTLRSNPEVVNQISQVTPTYPNVRDRMATMMPQQRKRPGGSANPFGNSPEEMRRQIEQFQRMSQRHGGTSGGFDAGGGRRQRR